MASYFCSLPLNFGNTPTDAMNTALTGGPLTMQDGDTATYWSASSDTGTIVFPLGASAVQFDAYYLVCENIGGYTGTALTAQTAPRSIGGATAARDTKQYAFHEISTQSLTSVTFNWTSRIDSSLPVRVYEFYVLNRIINVSPNEGYRQIDQQLTYRGARIQEALDGTRTRTRPLGNTGKWRVAYTMNLLTDVNAQTERLNQFFFDSPNFTHVVDYPTHPDRVYRAHLSGDGIRYAYLSPYTASGITAQFAIEER